MRNKIAYKAVLLSISALCCLSMLDGCAPSGTTSAGKSSNTNPRIEIDNVYPWYLPANQTSFSVTCKLYDVGEGTHNMHLIIRKHSSILCNAWSKDTTVNQTTTTVIGVYTDSLLSSCVSQNSIMRIVASADGVNGKDSAYYQWGNPAIGNSTNVNVERYRMPYVSSVRGDSITRCLIRSFNPADSNFLKVTLSFDPLRSLAQDTTFYAYNDEGYLRTLIDNYSQMTDSNINIDNKIIYGYREVGIAGILGISNTGSSSYQKWSILFKRNIDSLGASYNVNSIANQVAVHELLHQLSNIYGNKAHDRHLGYFANKCALNYSNASIFNEEFNTYTNRYRVCTYHATVLRTNLGWIPILSSGPFSPRLANQIAGNEEINHQNHNPLNAKYSLSMTLAKEKYKVYEPVIAKFELINNDSVPMKIYYLFKKAVDEAHVQIWDDKMHGYSINNFKWFPDMWWGTPRTIIEPGDTLLISMPINNWGEEIKSWAEGRYNDIYFHQVGYFNPGRYKAYFYFGQNDIERYGTYLQSNEVEFEVLDLNTEDRELLNLYNAKLFKDKDFDKIIHLYPDNTFIEHVTAEKFGYYLYKDFDKKMENEFYTFIDNYPNSYYFLDETIMRVFLNGLIKKRGSFETTINYLFNSHNSPVLQQAVRNKAFLRYCDFQPE